MKRFKIYLLALRVKHLETRYRRNPTLANLRDWSACCGTLYRMKHKPIDIYSAQ